LSIISANYHHLYTYVLSINQLSAYLYISIHLSIFRIAVQKLLEYEAKSGCPYSVEDATIGDSDDSDSADDSDDDNDDDDDDDDDA